RRRGRIRRRRQQHHEERAGGYVGGLLFGKIDLICWFALRLHFFPEQSICRSTFLAGFPPLFRNFPQKGPFLHSFCTTHTRFFLAMPIAMLQSAPSACVRCLEALLESEAELVEPEGSRG